MSTEEDILRNYKTIATVGLSSNPQRPSNIAAGYLKDHGYNIIPVNPNEKQVFGADAYPDLRSIPQQVDVVQIFRKSDDVPPLVEDAIKIGAKAVWMQEGVINEAAARAAADAGLAVVMDKCMKKEHQKLV